MLQREHLHRHGRRHVRVAVAITAGPRAEAQGRGRHRQVDAEAGKDGGDVGQHLRDGQPLGVDQVEHRVAGLVDRLGALSPELVGEPQQVDDLGQPSVGPLGEVGSRRERRLGRLRVEQVGEGVELGQRRPTGRFGGMGREHRPHLELVRHPLQLVGRHGALGDEASGAPQPAAVRGPTAPELPAAVHLLDDVGQVEVGVEGTYQAGGGLLVDVTEQLGGRRRVGPRERADGLDELEQLGALLAHERVAQQGADAPDVDAQCKVRVICRGAHRTRIASPGDAPVCPPERVRLRRGDVWPFRGAGGRIMLHPGEPGSF